MAGLVGFATAPAYVASKHGVVGLTRTGALENAKLGVRVNAVRPGIIRTPMIERATGGNAETEAQFLAAQPIGRMATPATAHVPEGSTSSDHGPGINERTRR